MWMGSAAVPVGAAGIAGQLTAPIWAPSPNFGERRDGAQADIVVLHYTAMRSAQAALDWMRNPVSEVSAHYLVGRDGTVWQLVEEADRAWHAGAGAWGDVTDVNSRSIGIEIDNNGRSPFAEPAMAALERLLEGILRRWSVPPHRVIGHSDCAPGRKIDPGPRFDWDRLARQGLAAPVLRESDTNAEQVDAHVVDAALQRLGYTASVAPERRLAAFRLRHLDLREGPAVAEDLARAEMLLRSIA